MVMDVDPSACIDKGGSAVQDAEVAFLAVVKGYVVNSVAAHCKLLAFLKSNRQRMADGVGRMGYVARRTGLRRIARFSADGVVVQGQNTDSVVHRSRSVTGGSNDFSQDIGDAGIIVSPLHIVNAVARFQAFQFQFDVFVFCFQADGSYRTVLIGQPVLSVAV